MTTLPTGQGPIAPASANRGARFPLQTLLLSRRTLAFAALGLCAYLLALAATIPAALIAPVAAGGTIWNGEAALPGDNRVRWTWAPLRSLVQLGFAADWHATGPATDLKGQALLKPGRVILTRAKGDADGSLLAALAPDLPFTCDLTMRVDLPRVALGAGRQELSGELRSDPGLCRARDGGSIATPVPALIATAASMPGGEAQAIVAPLGQRRNRLVKIGFGKEGRVVVGITPAGAAKLPFLSPTGGMTIETGL